jgi:hypothetical protein
MTQIGSLPTVVPLPSRLDLNIFVKVQLQTFDFDQSLKKKPP